MPARHLIVLAIPRGKVSSTVGRLTVVLAPRLRVQGDLNVYTDFRNWAQRCLDENMAFRLTVDGVEDITALTPTSATPVGDVWRAVFGPPLTTTVPVRPHRFLDRSQSELVSTDTAQMESYALGLLEAQAANGGLPLTKGDLITQFPGLQAFATTTSTALGTAGNDDVPLEADFDHDFHDSLRLLAAHPHLQRLMGLVWDFQVPLPSAPYNWISVRTNWPQWSIMAADPEFDEVPVRTAVTDDFVADVLDGQYRVDGWMKMSGAKYEVAQVAAATVSRQLQAIADVLADPEVATTDLVDIPAMEDGGIGIVHKDLATVLEARFDRQKQIEDEIDAYLNDPVGPPAVDPPTVYAEDLTTGFRVDIQDLSPNTSNFRSLHARSASGPYDFPANGSLTITPPADEGWSSIAMTTDGTPVLTAKPLLVDYFGDVHKREYRDETVWRVSDRVVAWNGWSLSTPVPGKTTTGTGVVQDKPTSAPDPEVPGNVVVQYEHVNGTLPKLRYGWEYRVRGRYVDLGGSSEALAAVAPSDALPDSVTYGRLAPVAAPIIIRRFSRPDPGVGDQPTILVIKSELDQANSTVTPTDRMLFPPSVSQSMVERHGLPEGGIDPASYADLATRTAASLVGQCLTDPETGEPVAGTAIVSGAVTAGPLTPDVTYLADPVGTGVAFRGLPNQSTDVALPYGTWPTYEGVHLVLRAGTAGPAIDSATRSVVASLPKGTTTVIDASHTIDSLFLQHMKAYQVFTPSERELLIADMTSGANSAISKGRRITLVHAVRVPLQPPSFPTAISGDRTTPGETTVSLVGDMGAHTATTDQITLEGRWVDPVDDLSEAAPGLRTSRAVIGAFAVPLAGDTTPVDVSFDLGDTLRRTVVISAEAFCRYSAYFTQEVRFRVDPGDDRVLNVAGVAGTSVSVTRVSNGQGYAEGRDWTIDPVTGTLSIPSGTTIPANTRIAVRYIPLPVSRVSSEASAHRSIRVQIPSSRAPIAPTVDALLPAFKRSTSRVGKVIKVIHDGRVVRLLLDRPWYSSGEREQLGVVVDEGSVTTPELTLWGRDPLSLGSGPTVRPSVGSFPLATATRSDLTAFDLAAHDVTYDASRGKWVCDIQVNAAFGYRPWIRLAVARYQGLSVDGTETSEVVTCQPVRLGERRVVTVARLSAGKVKVRVEGRDNVNQVSVVLQRRVNDADDPLLEWVDVSTTRLSRTGTRSASVHSGSVATSASGARRLVIEDTESVAVDGGTRLKAGRLLAYREVVDLPSDW